MNKSIFLSLSGALLMSATAVTVWAQDESDALRYSQLSPQGTARSMGFGSALGSVGGDFTSLSVNPAGIGVYRSSELVFTPSVKINSASGTYQGATTSDDVSRFNVNNFGMVFTNAKKGARYDKSKWKSTSFGIGFNRLSDYNRNYKYSGLNSGASSSSGSELFVAEANYAGVQSFFDEDNYNSGNNPPFAILGWESFLLDTINGQFFTVVPYEAGVRQGRMVSERGRYNEWAISFGGNYMEKLLLGATVGIPTLRYERSSIYSEVSDVTDLSLNPFSFNEYSYREDLITKGTGINLKLGFIYKATDQFRFGAAIHTPTLFGLTDVYNQEVSAQFNSADPYDFSLNPLPYSYTLTTPWRGVLSATGIIGKYGFISADYEYVGYNTARYGFDIADATFEAATNQAIRTSYKGASNFRIGAEARPTEILMLRVGFGYYGSPYKKTSVNADRLDISAGLGFRFQDWFIDFAFVNSSGKVAEQPYTLPYAGVTVPTAILKQSRNNAALTIGFKF